MNNNTQQASNQTPVNASANPFSIYQGNLAGVTPRPVNWLWDKHIPLSGITLLDGDHSLGKSLLALQIAAHISSGIPMPDGTSVPQSGVIIITPDTDATTTQLQLLTAFGADLSHVEILSYIPEPDPDDPNSNYRPFSLPEDLPYLFNIVKRTNARLVIFDPFINLLSTHNRWTDQRLARLLSNLNQRLIEHDIACLLIRNCSAKGGHAKPSAIERSERFLTTAISRLLLAPDPMQPTSPLLAHDFCRHSALSQTHSLQIQPLFEHPDLPHITFHGYHSLQARDLIENRPDVLRRLLLAQQLLGLIADAPAPMHVSTLYAQFPHFSPYQIQRSLADLLRTEQIERPARGFYAKSPDNPVFSPKTASSPPFDEEAEYERAAQETIAELKARRARKAQEEENPDPLKPSRAWTTLMRAIQADPELGPEFFPPETATTLPDTPQTSSLDSTAATTLDTEPITSLDPTAATSPDTPETSSLDPTAAITLDTEPTTSLDDPTAATSPDTPEANPPDLAASLAPTIHKTHTLTFFTWTPEQLKRKALIEMHMGEILRDRRLGRNTNWDNW
jgi:AAA domain